MICTTHVWNLTCCQAIQSWIFCTIHFWIHCKTPWHTQRHKEHYSCDKCSWALPPVLAYCKRSKTGWSEGLGTWLHIEFTLQFCIGENWYISSQFGWYIYTGMANVWHASNFPAWHALWTGLLPANTGHWVITISRPYLQMRSLTAGVYWNCKLYTYCA